MSLTAGALSTLRGPTPSREKYPEWVVTKTERLPPSRKCKPELLGEDGMREYSFFECVNGCGVGVKVLSDSLKQHKNQAIDDHLSTCQAIEEADRPAKVARGAIPVSILNDPEKMALVPALHKQCNERYEAVMQKVQVIEEEHRVFKGILTRVLPSLAQWMPLDYSHGEARVIQAIKTDILKGSSTVALPMVDISKAVAQDLATGDHEVLKRKYEALQEDHRVRGEQIDRLKRGRELKLSRAFHKRDRGILNDAENLLESLDKELRVLFAAPDQATPETIRALETRLLHHVSAYKRQRKQHAVTCERRTRDVDSWSDSE